MRISDWSSDVCSSDLLLLGERVGWRRWSAVTVGFLGILVMLRPTPETIRLVALVPLAAALFGALRDVVTRRMGIAGESTLAMMLVSTIVVALSGRLTLPFGWVAPGWAAPGLFSLPGRRGSSAPLLMERTS